MYDELNLAENDSISFINDDKLIKNVSHNSVLNCLLILTKSNSLYVYDCNTRSFLTRVSWNVLQQQQGDDNHKLASSLLVSPVSSVKVINIQEKCIILSDKTICSRTAYDGTLLLDSAFQLSLNSNSTNIDNYKFEIEISLNDAYTLVNVLKSIESELIHGLDELIMQLTIEIQKNTVFKNDSVSVILL